MNICCCYKILWTLIEIIENFWFDWTYWWFSRRRFEIVLSQNVSWFVFICYYCPVVYWLPWVFVMAEELAKLRGRRKVFERQIANLQGVISDLLSYEINEQNGRLKNSLMKCRTKFERKSAKLKDLTNKILTLLSKKFWKEKLKKGQRPYIFCNLFDHSPRRCFNISDPKIKRNILKRSARCFLCFETGHLA